MTIDNAIEHIKQARFDYCEFWEETKNDTTIAFDIAIDTMRKYQKIEDIVRDYYNEQYTDKLDIEIIEMISEVLAEDGKID